MCAATLASCTQTDVIEESANNAIGFESIVNKASRAENTDPVSGDLSVSNFTEFVAFGYYTKNGGLSEIFDNDIVTKTTEEVTTEDGTKKVTKWTYSPERYWNPGAKYNFYAYSCADIALAGDKGKVSFDYNATVSGEGLTPEQLNEAELAARGLKIKEYVCNAEHQHDLITAKVEGINAQTNSNNAVKFTFQHALCKVSVEFKNGFPTDKAGNPLYSIEVSDVVLNNFYNQADFDVRTRTWSNKTRINSVQDNISMANSNANALLTNPVFMLPVSYENANLNLNFTLSVKEANGNEVLNQRLQGSWKPEWQTGRAYKYEITLTGQTSQLEAIVFEADQAIDEADNWDNAESKEITFGLIESKI